jgi:hypothetical protein
MLLKFRCSTILKVIEIISPYFCSKIPIISLPQFLYFFEYIVHSFIIYKIQKFKFLYKMSDNLKLELRIFNSLINEETLCWVCQHKFNLNTSLAGKAVIPTPNIRESTCGHLIHASCAQQLLFGHGQVQFVNFSPDSEIQDEVFAVNCFCGLVARRFIGAEPYYGN